MTVCFFFFTAIPLTAGIWNIVKINKDNKEAYASYRGKMNQYEAIKQQNAANLKKVVPLENEMNSCVNERNRINQLIQKAYSANVIPRQYRDMYPIVYLYDWFSTSQADDLDHALSMYVLEEIKARLDTIIENQSQELLNQRIMMANQYKSLERQQSYERMMRGKLSALQATAEEQLYYTKMIECNTATNAYFAAAEYIRRI